MQNLKMLGCQNFCLPLIYLDIEFHQNRLNPYMVVNFLYPKVLYLWKILKMFKNVFLTIFPRSIDVAMNITGSVKFRKSKIFPVLFSGTCNVIYYVVVVLVTYIGR